MFVIFKNYGMVVDGIEVVEFILINLSGMEVKLINYGVMVIFVFVFDCEGNFVNVMFGYDLVVGYENGSVYFGVIVGWFCNWIVKGKFIIGG